MKIACCMRLCININEHTLSNRPNDWSPATCASKPTSMPLIPRQHMYFVRACVFKTRTCCVTEKHDSYLYNTPVQQNVQINTNHSGVESGRLRARASLFCVVWLEKNLCTSTSIIEHAFVWNHRLI